MSRSAHFDPKNRSKPHIFFDPTRDGWRFLPINAGHIPGSQPALSMTHAAAQFVKRLNDEAMNDYLDEQRHFGTLDDPKDDFATRFPSAQELLDLILGPVEKFPFLGLDFAADGSQSYTTLHNPTEGNRTLHVRRQGSTMIAHKNVVGDHRDIESQLLELRRYSNAQAELIQNLREANQQYRDAFNQKKEECAGLHAELSQAQTMIKQLLSLCESSQSLLEVLRSDTELGRVVCHKLDILHRVDNLCARFAGLFGPGDKDDDQAAFDQINDDIDRMSRED